ncbi:MAG: extracellular factor (EF) 3-hydroxypalmitic acid methyl ester biosynthesis protein [bacterium]|jgi:extracellular factor (EF) 3-hydroxypalmitic acid methyl ester biosynthesis protein
MPKLSIFLKNLSPNHVDSLLSLGKEKIISKNHSFIVENTWINSVSFIIQGLFKLSSSLSEETSLELLGPGEVIGTLGVFDHSISSTTITAMEDSLVFEVSHDSLEQYIDQDPEFGVQIYKSFGAILSNRLRTKNTQLGKLLLKEKPVTSKIEHLEELLKDVGSFKEYLTELDKKAAKTHNEISQEERDYIYSLVKAFFLKFNEALNYKSKIPEAVKTEIGKSIQREFLPFILLTEAAERFYSKPRGYAGDFFSIEMLYRNIPAGKGRLGPVIDYCILETSASKAVRNRRGLLTREIKKTLESCNQKQAKVMSIACGPAREVFDTFASLEDKSLLKATLLDMDLQSLSFVDDLLYQKNLCKQVELINENVLYLTLGRRKLEITPQDFIYSIGLIDYFEDAIVVRLLNYIYEILLPGGRVILGNFHKDNHDKAMMDYILDWKLIHRSEEDMNRLFQESKFQSPCTRIIYEEERINLFAECIKNK